MKTDIIRLYFLFLLSLTILVGQVSARMDDQNENKNTSEGELDKVEILISKAKKWYGRDMDSTRIYAVMGLRLAREKKYDAGIREGLFYLGFAQAYSRQYDQALKTLEEGMKLAVLGDDNLLSIQLLNTVGSVYRQLGQYDLSLSSFERAGKLATENNELTELSKIQVNLGNLYLHRDKDSLALSYQLKALDVRNEIGDLELVSNSLIEIGNTYEKMNNPDMALPFFKKALLLQEEFGNVKKMANILNSLSILYQKKGNLDESLLSAQRALKLARSIDDKQNSMNACSSLAGCYWMLKDYEKALIFHEISSAIKDSLFKEEKNELVAGIASSYEFSQKEFENRLLRQREEILSSQLKQKSNTLAVFCLSLIISSALAITLFFFNKSRKKKNEILNEQKDTLEDQSSRLNEALHQLQEAQSQLIQVEKMASLGQLTAGIAHEMNNPVNFIYAGIIALKKNLRALMSVVRSYDSIHSASEFKIKYEKTKKLKNTLNYAEVLDDIDGLMVGIEEGGERTAEIVRQLQNFSKKDSKNFTKTDLHQKLDTTLMLLGNKIEDNIEIVKKYDDGLGKVDCYAGQMNQVFMNIINNAIQAIGTENGTITIETFNQNEKVLIRISDTGKGMPKEIISKLYEPFFTTKEVGVGTGLGLFITYGIIERHKGHIEVDSKLNVGTTFSLTLPKVQVGEEQLVA